MAIDSEEEVSEGSLTDFASRADIRNLTQGLRAGCSFPRSFGPRFPKTPVIFRTKDAKFSAGSNPTRPAEHFDDVLLAIQRIKLQPADGFEVISQTGSVGFSGWSGAIGVEILGRYPSKHFQWGGCVKKSADQSFGQLPPCLDLDRSSGDTDLGYKLILLVKPNSSNRCLGQGHGDSVAELGG